MNRRSIPLFTALCVLSLGSSMAQTREPVQRVGMLSAATERPEKRLEQEGAVSPSLREAVRPKAEQQAEWKPYRLNEEQRLILRSQLRGEGAAQASKE